MKEPATEELTPELLDKVEKCYKKIMGGQCKNDCAECPWKEGSDRQ